ncbi:MAG TPA: cation:proton antiporter [Thermoanaerobaculia bacterium]|nr:cation:proton antiporter [Thermoanaerobaculia bacterium]
MRRPLLVLCLLLGLAAVLGIAPDGHAAVQEQETGEHAAEGGAADGHQSHVVPVLIGLVAILLGAKLGGELATRIGQPSVLGELVAGVVLGNLILLGFDRFEFIATNEGIAILAELGVILLLFEVGLESSVREMLSVGPSSLLVALLGVVAPFLLGWGLSAWMLPEHHALVHVFVGATLCATSVGITARVLTDLGKIQARESKIILGAAVIDDILGLVILAVVSGIITAANTGGELELRQIAFILGKAIVFLAGAVVIGGWLTPRIFRVAVRLKIRGVLLALALSFCMFLAWLAERLGLEPIVGAFAAGLILEKIHYQDFIDRGEHELEELLHPITAFLVPIFFVLTGMKVDLSTFGQVEMLGFAALLSVVAIIGKMLCWFGVLERGLDRISIAVGMVPRGEVGLIFAGIGASLMLHGEPVIDISVFSAVVIMVMVTTFITPPALKVTIERGELAKAGRPAAPR